MRFGQEELATANYRRLWLFLNGRETRQWFFALEKAPEINDSIQNKYIKGNGAIFVIKQ